MNVRGIVISTGTGFRSFISWIKFILIILGAMVKILLWALCINLMNTKKKRNKSAMISTISLVKLADQWVSSWEHQPLLFSISFLITSQKWIKNEHFLKHTGSADRHERFTVWPNFEWIWKFWSSRSRSPSFWNSIIFSSLKFKTFCEDQFRPTDEEEVLAFDFERDPSSSAAAAAVLWFRREQWRHLAEEEESWVGLISVEQVNSIKKEAANRYP